MKLAWGCSLLTSPSACTRSLELGRPKGLHTENSICCEHPSFKCKVQDWKKQTGLSWKPKCEIKSIRWCCWLFSGSPPARAKTIATPVPGERGWGSQEPQDQLPLTQANSSVLFCCLFQKHNAQSTNLGSLHHQFCKGRHTIHKNIKN